jgi:Flp pilus assembly pilin Flp
MRTSNFRGGTTAIEYALLCSLVGMVLAGALGPLRGGLIELWSFTNAVETAIGG